MTFPPSSLLLSLFLCFFFFFFFCCCSYPASAQCLPDQKSSLLTLFGSAHPPSWTPNTDCCSWWGVTCDGSGLVTGLDLTNCSISTSAPINSTSLLSLSSLRTLNLSLNSFNSSIPRSLGGLSQLTHVNLSNSGFKGPVPVEISRIKSLESLDLTSPGLTSVSCLRFQGPDFGYLVGNLSGLRELCLDGVNISSSAPESLAGLANLKSLRLRSCNLIGAFPVKVFQLRNLETLDLSSNPLLTGNLPPEFPSDSRLQILSLPYTNLSGNLPYSFGNLRHLQRLELKGCNFSGTIPRSLGGFSQLLHLDLSYNSFSGDIQFLGNLTQLKRLDLSSNRFSGWIPSMGSLKNVAEIVLSKNNFSGGIDSSFGEEALLSLTKLDLQNNSLSGNIPSALLRLPSLQHLDLSKNHFNSLFDEFGNTSSPLNSLDLSNNKLQGPIPKLVFRLRGLKVLVLSSNNFSGTVDFSNFQRFENLSSLDLSNNHLSIDAGGRGTNTSFPQITSLKLSSCNLTKFPDFLRNQSKLSTLDLSNNKIDDETPEWICRIGNGSLKYLNLSHNMLHSLKLSAVDLSLSNLTVLDLHSNSLQGPMPIPPRSIVILDYSRNNFTSVIPANISLENTIFFSLSENNFSGEIPSSICNANHLIVFDLSNNTFNGSIPNCLVQLDKLMVLNLGKNNFHGVIPQSFGPGCSLKSFNLNGNLLEGSLPESLANCTQLEVLNIGNNKINDSFPSWLGSLQKLRVLILRSNKFFGPIQQPEDRNAYSQLQIIDISFNGFTENLPSEVFQKLKAMMGDEFESQSLRFGFLDLNPRYYQESVIVTLKGFEYKFLNMLSFLTSLDLSHNKFQGSIPQDIGNLKSLHVLNMSENEFTGSIPSSFRNLTQLESLDLSMNRLSGGIPVELTSLTFLSALNLSENHLEGTIPQARQFLTFSDNSFQGNPGLCGPPLSKNCSSPPSSSESTNSGLQQPRNDFNWQSIWLGLGFGTGNGMVFGPLVFWRKGRSWYNKHVDKMLFMVTPTCAWFLIDYLLGKLEEEETSEQELMEFTSDMEREEEGEPFQLRFCVFCTKIDMGWKRPIHSECSCHDALPFFSSPGGQNTE